jgi:hypothetical protein
MQYGSTRMRCAILKYAVHAPRYLKLCMQKGVHAAMVAEAPCNLTPWYLLGQI